MSNFFTRSRKPGLGLDVACGCGFILGWLFVVIVRAAVIAGSIALCVWIVVYILQSMGVI